MAGSFHVETRALSSDHGFECERHEWLINDHGGSGAVAVVKVGSRFAMEVVCATSIPKLEHLT